MYCVHPRMCRQAESHLFLRGCLLRKLLSVPLPPYMHKCAHAHACMHSCTHARAHARTHSHTRAHTHTHTHARTHKTLSAIIYLLVHVSEHSSRTHHHTQHQSRSRGSSSTSMTAAVWLRPQDTCVCACVQFEMCEGGGETKHLNPSALPPPPTHTPPADTARRNSVREHRRAPMSALCATHSQ